MNYQSYSDTICAISSGNNINQPISIIRISGKNAQSIVSKIFSGKVGENKTITYGFIKENSEIVDEVLVSWFLGEPQGDITVYNNYVGEPLIEINAHGGMIVTNKILELLISNGARLAEPGEFTRRAFLNGKLDLSKADAIHNLIMSKTRLQARNEASKLKGSASKVIKDLLKELSLLIGSIEVGIDYPEYIDDYEEDLKANSKEDINLTRINKLIARLEKIVKSSETALNYFEGIKLAIVGKPNVGKSSLLNAMLKEDKAIVTNVAGTTRDIVEGIYYLDNFIFKIIDTAGIRKTRQEIEKIGIERSYKAILDADIVLHLFDNLNSEDEFDLDIKKIVQENNKNYIKVVNKSDLKSDIKWSDDFIKISAKNNDIKNLEDHLLKIYSGFDFNSEDIFATARQIKLFKESLEYAYAAREEIKNQLTYITAIVDLNNLFDTLQLIIGNSNREDLLDEMFKNFCLGK